MGRPPKHYSDVELAELRDRRNELRRMQYRLDGGKRKAENKEWKAAHREQVLEACRAYQRRRRAVDGEKAKERERVWRAKNKDKVKEYNKKRREGKFGREYNNSWQRANRVKDPVLYMLRNAKNRAKELGREFNLTRSDIVVPEICPVLGIVLQKGSGPFQASSPSIDRVDSSKGYISGNVQVISWRANALKRDGTLAEFRKIVAYMERE